MKKITVITKGKLISAFYRRINAKTSDWVEITLLLKTGKAIFTLKGCGGDSWRKEEYLKAIRRIRRIKAEELLY